MRGLDPRIHLLAKVEDCRVSPRRGGPAMTLEGMNRPAVAQRPQLR
jgi:hypothetical protein